MSTRKKTTMAMLPAGPVDARAQVSILHNSTFPFSSPTPDDHGSPKSIRTGNTALSQNPYQSPNTSTIALTDEESGATSEVDAWHLERYSELSQARNGSDAPTTATGAKGGNRLGLQVITDFSKPSYHTSNLVVDQVKAKQAETRRNRARSIVSQRAVKVGSRETRGKTSPRHRSDAESTAKPTRPKKKAMLQVAGETFEPGQPIDRAQSQKSILIGLSVPKHEASAFWYRDGLTTPVTPAIVLTPPDQNHPAPHPTELAATTNRGRCRPISSMYSTVTCSNEVAEDDEDIPPVPPIASAARPSVNRPRTVISPESSFGSVVAGHDRRRPPDHPSSQAENIPDSCDTPRSQGWWTLLLSPLLSRAGSSASRRDPEFGSWPPPVPAIPPHIENDGGISPLQQRTSPETPRRRGFATARGIPWSNWGEWEAQKAAVTRQPHGRDKVQWLPWKSNGTAAEYYEASAIEQATGVPYFECVNHSCGAHPREHGSAGHERSEMDPAVKSAPSPQKKTAATLGSPFDDQKHKSVVGPARSTPDPEQDQASVTEFESDDEPDNLAVVDEHSPLISPQENVTPADSSSEPDELSPNVRQANTAAVVRAKALGAKPKTRGVHRPLASPRTSDMPNIAAVVPARPAVERSVTPARKQTGLLSPSLLAKPMPALPEPPNSQSTTPMKSSVPDRILEEGSLRPGEHRSRAQFLSHQFFINPKGGLSGLPSTPTAARAFGAVPRPQSRASTDKESYSTAGEKSWNRNHRGDPKGTGKHLSRSWCFGRTKAADDEGEKKNKKKRRWLVCCICSILILIVIICVVLATTLTRRGDGTTIGSRWLNLTGYPPMPTGISTIAQPELTRNQDQCVQPATLWSCSLPKDDQSRLASNGNGVPQFRFEIKYRNGTTPAEMNIPLGKRSSNPFTEDFYTPSPTPPNDLDQLFLGNTTDNVTAPFNGEVTPFYISFMATFPVVPSAFNSSTKALTSRQSNLENNIPAPGSLPDGTATMTSLLPSNPYPASQPIRLYNRGQVDEHYGFYLYYDKSIFLLGVSISNGTAGEDSGIVSDADRDGGSTKTTARARCTWQQTRFLVKIYTSPKFDGTLFSRPPNSTTTTVDASTEGQYNSATDFAVPGSFPYPTSIVIDRHGGNINTKIAYCYSMSKGIVDQDNKLMVLEDRAVGGRLINAAPSFIDNSTSDTFNSDAGGIDGGTGGCSCQWQNWR